MLIQKRGRGARIDKRPSRECPKHLAWVRSLPCAVKGCRRKSQAHHVRTAQNSGTGMKPPDSAAVPLCLVHHSESHNVGRDTFEATHGVNLMTMADNLAAMSPHLERVDA